MRLLLMALLLTAPLAGAVIESYEFDNEDLRDRYSVLVAELRCPKCQNQNIADSNAPIAADLREQLHKQLHDGRRKTPRRRSHAARSGRRRSWATTAATRRCRAPPASCTADTSNRPR